VRPEGKAPAFDFTPTPATGTSGRGLGIIDFERGVEDLGLRFYVLRGMGARLQRALISLDDRPARHRSTATPRCIRRRW
jgi:seryl-tRNA synthetase